jgi:LPS export ABC transporter protein LptC
MFTKKSVRNLVVLLVVGLVGVLVALVGRAVLVHRQSDLAQKGLDFIPEVAQRIQDFHRVQVRDGRKVWEIAAAEARYFDEEQRVDVREPNLQLYLSDGKQVGIKGSSGRVSLDGKELKSVELEGGIEVSLANYKVETEYAVYDRARDLISAPGGVRISGSDLQAQGGAMEVEVGTQQLRLRRDVHMTLIPNGGAHGGA